MEQKITQWIEYGDDTIDNSIIKKQPDECIKWIILHISNSSNRKNHNITYNGRARLARTGNRSLINALLPRKGFQSDDEKSEENLIKYLNTRLYHMIIELMKLKTKDLGSNLGWITPVIFQFIDSTNYKIKILGINLLSFFSQLIDDKVFQNSGLIEVYKETLVNICYYLPPFTKPTETLQLFSVLYPCYLKIIRKNGIDSTIFFRDLKTFYSRIILQNTLPRISNLDPCIAIFVLKYVTENLWEMPEFFQNENMCINITRSIYTIGQYYVRNPFITVDPTLLKYTINFIEKLIFKSKKSLVIAHKYDFIACYIILYEKCDRENIPNIDDLRNILKLLSDKGAGLDNLDMEKISKERGKGMIKMFHF
ncbi:uncharacterized protein SCODWIG_01697 [Saccharomycodes ludwigii]|uniref:Uncharacterized protein n=1 Tax=Saccharomycodes ludwigii TaxID=36035 RepID=A0A376B5G4_9ASCO|nr:uncharacterized protein SCODWIG_01697 [Saccharomycodes ludwigii]